MINDFLREQMKRENDLNMIFIDLEKICMVKVQASLFEELVFFFQLF